MKKSILRGLASALALAVALVAPNVALAEESTEVDYNGGTQKIEKTYTNKNVDEEVEFTFELAYSYATEISGITVDDSALTNWSATTTINAKSDGITATSEKTISELLYDAVELITTPGTYYFTLSEVAGTNPNVSYDDTVYLVKVEVVWATDEDGTTNYSKVEVVSYTIYTYTTSDDGTITLVDKQDSADFNNTAATAASLKVTKDIQGAGANPSDTFTFTITVTGVSGTYTIEILDGVTVSAGDNDTTVTPITDDDGTITGYTVTASSGGTIVLTVVMGDDDYIVINGLPVGAEYTVTEDSTAIDTTRSYTSSGTVTDETELKKDTTVAVTNTASLPSVTGLLLTYGPFALVAVVAAAGIALVVVRRRRGYDEF